jgi:serine-type D-Ala-D-Ala carboxypeptidase/endopeptidase (penicillin-binding protein 4)
MCMFRICLICLLFLSFPIFAGHVEDQLFNQIEYQVSEHRYDNVSVGISVDKISNFKSTRLYSRNADQTFIPASTIKPLLCLAVLKQFGKNYRFNTFFMGDNSIEKGTLEGNFYIKGMGDPSLERADLIAIVSRLKKMGLTKISGDIVYDTSLFKTDKRNNFKSARYYNAPSSALSVDSNQLNLIIDPVSKKIVSEFSTNYADIKCYGDVYLTGAKQGFPWPVIRPRAKTDNYIIYGDVTPKDQKHKFLNVLVSRPGLFFTTQFKEICTEQGISISGDIVQGVVPKYHKVLLEYKGETLESIIYNLNQESDNVVAKILNRNLAAFYGKVPAQKVDGLTILNNFCQEKLHFREGTYFLDDASGLSLKNRLSADHFSTMLSYIYKKKSVRKVMINSFVKLGEHEKYMQIVPPKHLDVYIKTGTLASDGVNSIVGYIFNKNKGDVYSFSILTDHETQSAHKGALTYPIMKSIFQALI